MAETTAEKEDQVKPLALTAAVYPTSSLDEEGASRWRSAQYLRKRQRVLFCCGCCGVVVVVLGLVALVLALTVFKVKDPVLTMNSIHLDVAKLGVGAAGDHPAASDNVTLTADVSIKNPNVASYRFRNSTTQFYYGGQPVGVAYAPGGTVSADRTVRMNVMTDRVARLENMTKDILEGSVNLTSSTQINGKVNLFGVFRRELDVFFNCSMTVELSLAGQDVKSKVCGVKTL